MLQAFCLRAGLADEYISMQEEHADVCGKVSFLSKEKTSGLEVKSYVLTSSVKE